MADFSLRDLLIMGLLAMLAGVAWAAMALFWGLSPDAGGIIAIMAAVVLAGFATLCLARADRQS